MNFIKKAHCTTVLSIEVLNVKALYRRAVALEQLNDIPGALLDAKELLRKEKSAEFVKLAYRLQDFLRKKKQRQKSRAGAMFEDTDAEKRSREASVHASEKVGSMEQRMAEVCFIPKH